MNTSDLNKVCHDLQQSLDTIKQSILTVEQRDEILTITAKLINEVNYAAFINLKRGNTPE